VRRLVTSFATLALIAAASANADPAPRSGRSDMSQPRLTRDDVRTVSPALAAYTEGAVLRDLWQRPGLSTRDRSIVTLAALIARQQIIEMPAYFARALDGGVTPREISEIVLHLAFYSGWPNAMAAVAVAKDVFAARKIGAEQLPAIAAAHVPLDEAAEASREARVGQQFGAVAPALVQDTTDRLFRDLWLRPDLNARDRSLVTVSALIASGQTAQLSGHLVRALDNGLTEPEVGEVVAHLAYYAGWPNAFSALPVVKSVFAERSK
jgi:4-carboxymuconolactone decarboxylase